MKIKCFQIVFPVARKQIVFERIGNNPIQQNKIISILQNKKISHGWPYILPLKGLNYTCEGCDSSCNNQSGFICNQCEDAYYLTSGKCESCSSGCKICSDLQTCTQCSAYTYYSGPDQRGYYLQQNSCFSCSSNCKSCSNSQTCTECLNTSYLDQGYCYSYQRSCQIYTASQKCTQCGSGYYLSQGSCFACSNNCQSCNDSQTCTQCFNSNYLDQGQCYSYQSSCNIYTIEQKCTLCYSGYYLSQSYCFSCSSNCNSCTVEIDMQSQKIISLICVFQLQYYLWNFSNRIRLKTHPIYLQFINIKDKNYILVLISFKIILSIRESYSKLIFFLISPNLQIILGIFKI